MSKIAPFGGNFGPLAVTACRGHQVCGPDPKTPSRGFLDLAHRPHAGCDCQRSKIAPKGAIFGHTDRPWKAVPNLTLRLWARSKNPLKGVFGSGPHQTWRLAEVIRSAGSGMSKIAPLGAILDLWQSQPAESHQLLRLEVCPKLPPFWGQFWTSGVTACTGLWAAVHNPLEGLCTWPRSPVIRSAALKAVGQVAKNPLEGVSDLAQHQTCQTVRSSASCRSVCPKLPPSGAILDLWPSQPAEVISSRMCAGSAHKLVRRSARKLVQVRYWPTKWLNFSKMPKNAREKIAKSQG
jgi:hypothetical protein